MRAGALAGASGAFVLGAATCLLPSYDMQLASDAGGGGNGGTGLEGGAGASGGVGAQGGQTSQGGGGTGGTGGSSCGNGVIEGDEQCDSGGTPSLGCADCEVICEAPDALDLTTNHCYRAVNDGMPEWDRNTSEEACAAWDGDLIAISSADELAFIRSNFLGACNFTWTSGREVGMDDPEGVWDNGEDWYAEWLPGEPNAGQGACVILHNGCQMADEDCGATERGYMCERRPAGAR